MNDRWNDDRLDDLSQDVRSLLPLHISVATCTLEIKSVREDITNLSEQLTDAKDARKIARGQLWHGVVAAIIGSFVTVTITYIIAGGVILK